MNIELIDNYKDFLAAGKFWNRLLEKSSSNNVFLTFEWLDCWWQAYGKEKKLNILLVKEADAVMAIAALMSENALRAGLPVKIISFIYNDNASRADFILSERPRECLGAVINWLESNKNRWDVIELQNIAEGSPSYEILKTILGEIGFPFAIKDGLRSPFVPVNTGWEAYFASRSRNFRKNLRHLNNRISKEGVYTVEEINDADKNRKAPESIFAISAKSWKARCKRDISAREEDRKFYKSLYEAAAKNGWLKLWILKLNETAICYEYHLKYDSKVYSLRSDFDERYKNISPGTYLSCQIMKSYFGDSVREYDFCGHDDGYKKNWASLARRHYTFVIYNNSVFGRMLCLLDYKFMYRLKIFLKRIKFIKKTKRFLERRH